MSTTTMITTLRNIAACYTRAANALEDATLLASTLAPDSDRAASEFEPTAMLVGVVSEPATATTGDANTIERAYVEAIEALGWDPDKLNTRDARDCIYALRTLEDLDYAEALEKRRAEMRPARKVRESVLDAITVRRDVLADPARAPRKAAP